MTMSLAAAIEWFKTICNKDQCKFAQIFMKGFYPSVTQTILDNGLLFAKEHV